MKLFGALILVADADEAVRLTNLIAPEHLHIATDDAEQLIKKIHTAGAAFLFSVMLTQWPLAPGAQPIYYQSVEFLALLVLATTGAGKFAGLDFFLSRCCKGSAKTDTSHDE